MKKIITIGIFAFGFSVAVNAQENKEKQPERIKLVKVENTSQNSTNQEPTQKFATPEEEIAWCENQIKALDQKEEWIKNNPEETKIAEENGWFTEAEAQRVSLKARIEKLKTK